MKINEWIYVHQVATGPEVPTIKANEATRLSSPQSISPRQLESLSLSLSLANPMTAAPATPSRAEILSLLRSLLRVSAKFSDYNIREYTRRRTIDGIRQNRTLSDPSSVANAFADGKSELEIAKRQAVVYSLYAPKVKSIIELYSKRWKQKS